MTRRLRDPHTFLRVSKFLHAIHRYIASASRGYRALCVAPSRHRLREEQLQQRARVVDAACRAERRRLPVRDDATGRQQSSGDLNGDGHADLVTANQNSGDVTVLLGYGDGTFAVADRHATARYTEAIAVADLDGDGRADIAAVGSSGYSVLLNATP
jgi:hypothetical protein